ncbi:YqiA/YcfP family alpha/beta fold hydrolase [Gloeocapsa sp. PCC 73106]|uniref:YqiA/YcfP family alpha/beta fold hydrolase n=1 Tax=Gloeocapsa sp. PCC 73106 TaxID=102232 RepID=UPI0002ABECDD|nr:YqiA/YcfP family alpha/beta fold hydrolase [Gloeocapsa sp. PCC 73106]ELR98363.1 putative esterase [Gloeocapsa sp. PCC 73106]
MNNCCYIYLHGFASGPKSSKAQYFWHRYAELGISLSIPDLNQGDFSDLTLTRQLQQVGKIIKQVNTPVILIGSSFGGLTGVWLSQNYPQIQSLILLAPAFNFLFQLNALLGEEAMTQWRNERYYLFYHHAIERSLPLHYQFIVDLAQYPDQELKRSLPTLIFHGVNDTIIPIESSLQYRDTHPHTQLVELNSDHNLTDVLPDMWSLLRNYIV